MSLEALEPEPGPGGLIQYEIIRLDGTVLLQFVSPPGTAVRWFPEPGGRIECPCAGRYRVLPDGPWSVRAYYPDGFPGPQAPWPEPALAPPGG